MVFFVQGVDSRGTEYHSSAEGRESQLHSSNSEFHSLTSEPHSGKLSFVIEQPEFVVWVLLLVIGLVKIIIQIT